MIPGYSAPPPVPKPPPVPPAPPPWPPYTYVGMPFPPPRATEDPVAAGVAKIYVFNPPSCALQPAPPPSPNPPPPPSPPLPPPPLPPGTCGAGAFSNAGPSTAQFDPSVTQTEANCAVFVCPGYTIKAGAQQHNSPAGRLPAHHQHLPLLLQNQQNQPLPQPGNPARLLTPPPPPPPRALFAGANVPGSSCSGDTSLALTNATQGSPLADAWALTYYDDTALEKCAYLYWTNNQPVGTWCAPAAAASPSARRL